MTLLFILDSVENATSPNCQLARRLAAALTERGQAVHLLELWDGQTPPPSVAKTIQHRLAFEDERLMNAALENGASQGSPLPLRLLRLLVHPTAAAAAFRQLVLKRPRRTVDTAKEIERLDKEFHFDAVCAVAAPYQAAFALEQASIGGKKLLWQMDPYAANRTYTAPGGYEREAALLGKISHVFLMPETLPDYAEGRPLACFAAKASVLHLPFLVQPKVAQAAPHEGIFCTFCGTLYPDVREPYFAFELFSALQRKDLTLTIAGGGMEKFSVTAQAAQKTMGEHLKLTGRVPLETAKALQNEADILLILGNKVENQISSKVFEYCAAGKPILYLAALENDPALPYLTRYPLALVLQQQNGVTPHILDTLNHWIDETNGKRLPFEAVANLLPEFTPTRAAEDFLKVFNSKS